MSVTVPNKWRVKETPEESVAYEHTARELVAILEPVDGRFDVAIYDVSVSPNYVAMDISSAGTRERGLAELLGMMRDYNETIKQ